MRLSREDWEKNFTGYYKGEVEFDVPMKGHTSLAIGGPADIVVSPEEPVSVKNIVMLLGRLKARYVAFGGGTNVLVRDGGIEGVVVKLGAFSRVEIIHEEDESAELFVEAGAMLQKLVNLCRDRGYTGMEGLTGIPGTVGGAICGNAGSFGVEIKDALASVVLLRSDGALERCSVEDLGFGYRKSDIRETDIVLSANITLRRDDTEAVAQRTEKFIKQKKAAQPVSGRSAGCVFRNPEGMSAGRLIDEAGCKGMRIGDIEVSGIHANFFLNLGNGKASDYLALMDAVSARVQERSGFMLEPEIRIIGKE